ncbi:MAG: GntR family transcriptional regulator [Gammaproteobacteria bacterium]|nr:GntR family transcriptional regulator [Gammaproteobacteria bacterium]
MSATTGTIHELESQRTMADKAYEQLKNAIIRGDLAQGSKITEEDLAAEFGFSRGPIREAIRRLEGMKLVVRVPHAGARVVTLSHQMMSDLYTVRESLEGMSARLAARSMSKEKIEELRALLDQHEQKIAEADGKNYFQSEGDFDFHYRVAQASNNEWLIQHLFGELYQLVRMCRYQTAKRPRRPVTALMEHRQILEAIARHDEELAELLMRRHISGAWEVIKPLLPREEKENHD